MAARDSTSFSCKYKNCTLAPLTEEDGRVEVCTVLPKQQTSRQGTVAWKEDGSAMFHQDCWKYLLSSARSRKKSKDAIKLSPAEVKMIKEAAKTAEIHDSLDTIKHEGERIAGLIKAAKHCVCFTGAGISTSAGIGDYRGKKGKWTEEDRVGVEIPEEDEPPNKRFRRNSSVDASLPEVGAGEEETGEEEDGVPYESLRPTYTHEALYKLSEMGLLKHIISQNGDGLHGLSGVSPDDLSELHGNVFLEKCEKCGERYTRSYYVMDDVGSQYYEELEDYGRSDVRKPKHARKCDLCGLSHRTGRRCQVKGCKGFLMDTIINFRDTLEEAIIDRAFQEGERCDLMLALGTTLTVTPANEVVELGREPLRIVICNRQKTDYDELCTKKEKQGGETLGSRVFGDCDVLMKEVMSHLLAKKELEEWEEGRGERMEVYNSKRSTVQ